MEAMDSTEGQETESDCDVYDLISKAFPILNINDPTEMQLSPQCLDIILQKIHDLNLSGRVSELVIFEIEGAMRHVAEVFWSYFPNVDVSPSKGFRIFKDAVDSLMSNIKRFEPTFWTLNHLLKMSNKEINIYDEKCAMSAFKVIIRSSLHPGMLFHNRKILEDFYKVSLKVFLNKDAEDSTEDIVQCSGCDNSIENCNCKETMQIFEYINKKLMQFDLLERLAGDILTNLIQERIENHVQDSCKGSFDTSYVESLDNWLKTVVVGWLQKIYINASEKTIKKFEQKLSHLLYETYTRTRIDQLFNIIIEYPDSQPAVEDLRLCLQKTDLQSELQTKLQKALETRLLHPGVNTLDVLTAYIAAVKALRQLDPTGVLLETVTHPVRQYLRYREDSVRCIIKCLLEDGSSEVVEEIIRGQNSPVYDGSPAEEDFEHWEKWNPDPIEADSSKPSRSRRTSDVISMLVNVYGSKDSFVKEYTNLLAGRLLASPNFQTEKEHRYLELLKLRFGEAPLNKCEVMLKDIYDSKRINMHLHCEADLNLIEQAYPTTAKILSASFWPTFKEDTLELPAFVKAQMEIYTKSFRNLKGNRTLCWKPNLGTVNLDIELKDRVINMTVSPTRATILWHYQTKPEWTVEELSTTMQVPSTKLRREIGFWQSQGLLREVSPDTFLLIEESTDNNCLFGGADVCEEEEEETESVMASAQDQREEELQVFWSYIVGMLTNLESMPLDRIHQMLKMFASQGPYSVECTQPEVRAFLDRKVREHKLIYSGGLYRLPKL